MKQGRDVLNTHMTTDHHSMSHPVTTPSDHTYWPHALIIPTSHNFNLTFLFSLQILKCKRNVRLKIVASGCDQSVWPVGVVAGCGRWVWSLGGTLNDDQWSYVFFFKTSLPCFHSFFNYITINHQPYIAFNFLQKNVLFVIYHRVGRLYK